MLKTRHSCWFLDVVFGCCLVFSSSYIRCRIQVVLICGALKRESTADLLLFMQISGVRAEPRPLIIPRVIWNGLSWEYLDRSKPGATCTHFIHLLLCKTSKHRNPTKLPRKHLQAPHNKSHMIPQKMVDIFTRYFHSKCNIPDLPYVLHVKIAKIQGRFWNTYGTKRKWRLG